MTEEVQVKTVGDNTVGYKNEITKFTTSTPAHADFFNVVFQDLINNDAVLREIITSRLKHIDMAITYDGAKPTISHGLNEYPMVNAHFELLFGVGGFGEGVMGGGTRMQVPLKVEYVDSNTVTLNLDEELDDTNYTVTKVDNYNFDVIFINNDNLTLKVKLFV